jgi:dTDP-4-dehydrorhamnose reductase
MKVMVLGASGMLGHLATTYLEEGGHDVVAVSRRGTFGRVPIAVDLEDWSELRSQIEIHKPNWIVNAAGLLNDEVDEFSSSAILVNSFLPRKLADTGQRMGFRLLTVGSDCVFQGDRGKYLVTDSPDSVTAYGKTKHLGEVNTGRDLTIRTSIIGPEIDSGGKGLLQWFMAQDSEADGWTSAVWTGLTTLELAKVIGAVVSGKLDQTGLWHCVPADSITKYELLQVMNEKFRVEAIEIHSVSGQSHDRSLVNDRPKAWTVPGYAEMMVELRGWVVDHQNLYIDTLFELDDNEVTKGMP